MKPLFDVREGEARGSVTGFTAVLLLVIGAHTVLETARDTLLLTGPGPKALGLVYMIIAAATVPGAALAVRAGERFGQRRALAGILGLAVLGPLCLALAPAGNTAAMAIYVLSGVLGSIVVPQFWTMVGSVLNVAQGRRLFGIISGGGIVGGILGPAVASAALVYLPVRSLLIVSSAVFASAIAALGLVRSTERAESRPRRVPFKVSVRALREQPFLLRVALVALFSTATFLTLDYFFKAAVARELPRAEVGPFVAHYYLALNCSSLVVQLLMSGTFIPRFGVLPALMLTPVLLLAGAVAAAAGGGKLFGALLLKTIDGSLRYSIHRVTGELVYLPVPGPARKHSKPFIDGALVRAAQTLTGAALLMLGGSRFLEPRWLALGVAILASGWLAVVVTMRRPYLRLLRQAITAGSLEGPISPEPIDIETAQLLVQRLGSEDPAEVEGAMAVLARRGRVGFVPALVLLHHDEGILVQALEMFGDSARTDWVELAVRLLEHPHESVRVAAARALARHDRLDPALLANDAGWRARGYAAVRMALRDGPAEILAHPSVAALLERPGDAGARAVLGMLAAVADTHPSPRLRPLLGALADRPRVPGEGTELFALAVARQQEVRLIPQLVACLEVREGREAVRAALVALGEPAQEEVRMALRDPTRSQRLRLHVPKTLARFATRAAAGYLLEEVETEMDGSIRYKSIRALRLLVAEHRIVVDRGRVERVCCADLEKHFRSLSLRVLLDGPAAAGDATQALLTALLQEKAAQALQRAFQLLQIAHPRQGVHRAYLANRSDDPYVRANAAELLDMLLRHADQRRLRALFRLAVDDLPTLDRVTRAGELLPGLPRTAGEATRALVEGTDTMLVALGRRLLAGQSEDRAGEAGPVPAGR